MQQFPHLLPHDRVLVEQRLEGEAGADQVGNLRGFRDRLVPEDLDLDLAAAPLLDLGREVPMPVSYLRGRVVRLRDIHTDHGVQMLTGTGVEAIEGDEGLSLSLYRPMDAGPQEARLKVFRIGPPLSLSNVLPVLSSMGVEVVAGRDLSTSFETDVAEGLLINETAVENLSWGPPENAVGKRIQVIVDSGFRRGSDVVKALALGADAVLIGRGTLYGVAAGGHAGATRAIEIYREEISRVMALLGVNTIDELVPELLHFTDNGFHNIGLKEDGEADLGRFAHRPIKALKGAFKTPTLRDIALTAPYMHNGIYATLEEVVEHYARGGDVKDNLSPNMKPLDLSAAEKRDLVEFMRALTSAPQVVTVPNLPQ